MESASPVLTLYFPQQINVRLPSMLIEADGLKRDVYPESHNFEQIVSKARDELPPTPGYALNPIQQREAMHQRQREQQRDDLVVRASGRAGESGRWIATQVLLRRE